MKTVSFKIKDTTFEETEKLLSQIKKPWNIYVNEALEYYNRSQKQLILGKKLKKESDLVKRKSLTVLKDFESIDYSH